MSSRRLRPLMRCASLLAVAGCHSLPPTATRAPAPTLTRDASTPEGDAAVDAGDAATDASDASAADVARVDPAVFERLPREGALTDESLVRAVLVGPYWAPYDHGRCARITFEAGEGGALTARTRGFHTNLRVLPRAPSRPVEVLFEDPSGRTYGGYPSSGAGVLMFLIGLEPTPLTTQWDGLSLNLFARSSIEGNAVIRFYRDNESCQSGSADEE